MDPAHAGKIRVGFEATGGQEWALWVSLVAAGIEAVQQPPAQITAFARSRGTLAKTDRLDAEHIAGFMLFRPESGRVLPNRDLRVLRALTTRRARTVKMRKRFTAQISTRERQGVAEEFGELDTTLKAALDDQVADLESRIESLIAREEQLAAKARLLRFIAGIGPVPAAMLIAERPELDRRTAEGRRALRHVLFQAALAAACHNPTIKPLAKRLKERGKPHKLVIVASAPKLITIASAALKMNVPRRERHVP